MKNWLRNPLVWLGLGVVAVLFVYPYYQRIFAPNVHTPEGKPTEFFIHSGSDYRVVGQQLLDAGCISDPKAFVITLEQPGGVVVSKQEEVVAIAKPS